MRQYVLPADYDGSDHYRLTGRDYHYFAHVLRAKPGNRIPAVDGKGLHFTLTVEAIDQNACLLSIAESPYVEAERSPEISLFQCMPKGRKLELIVRQATEAGVRRIIPLQSDHSVPKPLKSGGKGVGPDNDRSSSGRLARLRRIARQAMQQSGAQVMPEIHEPVAFRQLTNYWEGAGTALYFHEVETAHGGLHEHLADSDGPIAICVGPEGGFSQSEVKYLDTCGFMPVFLPVNVLRTETASLYAIAAVQVVLGERSYWKHR